MPHHSPGRLPANRLNELIQELQTQGYRIIAPQVQDQAITLSEIHDSGQLPLAIGDRQGPGSYRLTESEDYGYFGHTVGQSSWKRYLFPAEIRLWHVLKTAMGIEFIPEQEDIKKLAFFGVRPCDLAAIERQNVIFSSGPSVNNTYRQRRDAALMVAVNCSHCAATCFCHATGTGPHHTNGYDLLLTEFIDEDSRFLVEAGSETGEAILDLLPTEAAKEEDIQLKEDQKRQVITQQTRTLPDNVHLGLAAAQESRYWQEIGKRCLNCGNCTLVCPTCFCSTTIDTTNLTGDLAEHWQVWDSCFNLEHSTIHGGAIHYSGGSRYRQWITHKLSYWREQFGSSGCTGCGRCITWCPVGIDLTEEATRICTDGEV